MDKIVIEGGRILEGEVAVSGAKNAALPILISSLLTEGWNTFYNVPDLRDIQTILDLLEQLGAQVKRQDDCIQIDASGLHNHEASYDLVRKMRASVLVLGPLVARLKKARVSLPGGCAIGARPINLHLKGLTQMGADITLEHGYVQADCDQLTGSEIYLDIPTVTGTENLMMAAVLAKGTTVLRNAAREPEITALADTLIKMGANVKGAGTSIIQIEGVTSLKPVSVSIIPDRIETGTFMVASALTQGHILIKNTDPDLVAGIVNKLKMTGAMIDIENKNIRVRGKKVIESTDVKTLPYPGFPTDMQAQFMVLMTIARGLSIISETIFENRFIHVSELKRMGADITISGNSALIKGVSKLSGAHVMATDLRASASLILAGLVAEGITEVHRVYHLDRGYERIENKFVKLGAIMNRAKE